MNDLINNPGTDVSLPDDYADKLLGGIAESRASTHLAGGGKPFLRMMKSGEWVFGPSNEEVQEGSRWVINITSLVHGWCCWVDAGGGKNELQGEVMVSMTQPKPARPAPIGGTPYAEQRGFALKCIDGADAGTEVIFKTNSIGGMNAVDDLLAKIHGRLAVNRKYPCPVVTLASDHYQNKKYGRIYVPILTVAGWSNMAGELEGNTPAPAAIAADKPAPAPRVRKAPLTATASPAVAGNAAPAPTARVAAGGATAAPAPTTGQRRRPAAS